MKQKMMRRRATLEECLLPEAGEPTTFVVKFIAHDKTVMRTLVIRSTRANSMPAYRETTEVG